MLMMTALFILFQGPQYIRERYNTYDFNDHYREPILTAADVWDESQYAAEEIALVTESADLEQHVREWANYSKRRVVSYPSVAQAASNAGPSTVCVVVTKETWEENGFLKSVRFFMDKGTTVVLADLPDVSVIQKDFQARKLLGIDKIVKPEITVDGLHLFGGFLLGGERIFMPMTEAEEDRQDLELTMPWYRTGAGTETFMMGIFRDDLYEGEKLDNEELPPVIWSASQGKAKVYAVQGDYMHDRMIAMGIMSAVMADVSEFSLYPVVNSQQLQIINFPSLANENQEVMQEIYSRTQNQFEQNIVYPGLKADIDRNGFNLTAYLMPQYDYSDENEPVYGKLAWYLEQLKEQKAELGYSLVHNDTVTIEQKLEKDVHLLESQAPNYKIAAIYSSAEEAEDTLRSMPEAFRNSVNTICTENYEDKGLIDYLDDRITIQQSTAMANTFSYRNDLQMMGAETALGYASISVDLKRILWPESEEDQWQIASKRIFSVIDTYFKNFNMFDHTTASETDRNLRNLLSVFYACQQDGNVIHLSASQFTEQISFILRLHNRKVTEVSNGSFEKIAQDAYLIRITEPSCEILLEDDVKMDR